ncbi:membrane fusion protein HasE [Syntrophus gentianae]|uniref:Membrane fusion protein HasE n=1 Tax=Syntrophus gentianae TaxID=43775 RepID=A0A1H7ZNH8_9BACT|nr:HlyD family type I secretion periplasmic adaptor subunit [Syntrophus gentianae]SEM59833.1 membrane fusion protein HasE [Syntrophus gentianae]
MNGRERQGLDREQPLPLKTSTRPIILVALLGLIFGLGAFLAWASLAPLDEGVVAHGEVTVVSNKKTIQHQYGGTVSEILVKEGDRVKKGQVLIRLNNVQPKADLANMRGEYYQALALEARLLAERNRAVTISFPKEIYDMSNMPEIADIVRTQRELFNARRGTLQTEINILKDNIDGTREYIRRLEELQMSRTRQMDLLKGEMDSLRQLADQGYYPRTKILETERLLAELSGKRSEDLGNIARARKGMSEYQLTILRRQQEFLQDVETRLSEVQTKLAALRDQYAATQDVLEKTEIKAPEEGTVVGLAIHTTGGVIMPGNPVMSIVPANEELIVEAKVMTTDRDRVREKLKVDLMFTSFDIKKTPVIDGEVILVSADRFTDEATKIPYYLCRIRLTQEGLRKLGNRHLEPGMPVQVVIKTGERTLMNYLVKPLFDRISVSFKER